MLTGKCREGLIEYFHEKENLYDGLGYVIARGGQPFEAFEIIPFPMQYGVIVDFFDQCEVEGVDDTVVLENAYIAGGHTRQEARIFAVEKNCKRYNQNHDH